MIKNDINYVNYIGIFFHLSIVMNIIQPCSVGTNIARGMPCPNLPVSKVAHKTAQFFSKQHRSQAIPASFDDLEVLKLSLLHCFVGLHTRPDKFSIIKINNIVNSLSTIFTIKYHCKT